MSRAIQPPLAERIGQALLIACASLFVVNGCTDRSATQPESDFHHGIAVRDQAPSGVFDWLAPLGSGTADPATFDPAVAPEIEICAWNASSCSGTPIARFSTTPTTGVGSVIVNSAVGAYEGSWSLLSTSLTTRKTYRIRVLQRQKEIGAASVDVVRGRWALTRDDGTLAPLTSANQLDIRFHVARSPTEASVIADAAGGQVSLPDGAAFAVPAGAIQGRIAFRLRRVETPIGSVVSTLRAPIRDAQSTSPDCNADATHELTITRDPGGAFLPGDKPLVFTLPLACPPASGQSLYFRGHLLGGNTGSLWKSATRNTGTSLTASSTFAQGDFLPLNVVGSTSLSTAPVLLEDGDPLSCQVGNDLYPQLTRESDGGGTAAQPYAIVLVHGWLSDVHSCDNVFPTRNEFSTALLMNEVPGRAYFTKLLSYFQGPFADARFYTYTYPTYRPFTEPGQNLAAWLNQEFGATGAGKNVSGIVLVGHSMGGLVARVAAQNLSVPVAAKLKGIITLATPHFGTPAPALKVLGFYVFDAGAFTPGGQSLLPDAVNAALPHPESEMTPMFAYGGNMVSRCQPGLAVGTCSPDAGFALDYSWNALCNFIQTCDSDGVVPIQSAVPTFVPPSRQRPGSAATWANYSHTEMKDGRTGASDPLFAAIAKDIRSLIGPQLLATEVPGTNVDISPPQGTVRGVCILSKYLAPITPDGAKTWSLHFSKGAVYPNGVSLLDFSSANEAICENGNGIVGLSLIGASSAPGDQLYLTIIDSDGNSAYAAWTWDGAKATPHKPAPESVITVEFSPGVTDMALSGSNLFYFTGRQNFGCGSQTLEKVSRSGGPVTVLASNLACPLRVVSDGAYAYWTDAAGTSGGAIRRVSVDGGSIETLISDLALTAQTLVLDEGYLYFASHVAGDAPSASRIRRISTSDNSISDIISTAYSPAFTVSSGLLYYEDDDPAQQCQGIASIGAIRRVPVSGGTSATIAANVPFSCGGNNLFVAGNVLYITHGYSADVLSTVPINGGTLTTRATGLQSPTHLMSDGTFLYLSSNSQVLRFDLGNFQKTVLSWRQSASSIVDSDSVYWTSTYRVLDNCCGGGFYIAIIRAPKNAF